MIDSVFTSECQNFCFAFKRVHRFILHSCNIVGLTAELDTIFIFPLSKTGSYITHNAPGDCDV